MFGKAVLCLSTLHFYGAAAQGDCVDLRGRSVSNGMHYVPGPDTCTLCVCEMGQPKICKAVLCSPPQDCRSFRVGTTCCEFICLDDVVKPADGAEANVRVAAGGAAAIVLVTVALVVYRVRKQKRRRNTHADDQRSLTSIGYISGSMGYMGGQCETALGVWKPHGNYLPRGEAPPPYEEVVGQCQMENYRMANEGPPYHRTYPTTMEAMGRPDDMCNGHGYVNIPRPVPQIANPQSCYNAPLLQPVHPTEVNQIQHHAIAANMGGVGVRARLTGSLGAISGRLSVPREPEHERPHNVPGFYANTHALHTALHRTIPRITTAIEALELGAFRRAEPGGGLGALGGLGGLGACAGAGEVRRSFHRPCAPRRDTGRSVPRHLDLASAPDDSSVRHVNCSGGRSRAHSEDNVGGEPSPPLVPPAPPASLPPAPPPAPPPVPAKPEPAVIAASVQVSQNTLPLKVDKPSCVCSYAGASGSTEAPPAEEPDDYRSECENCKSASSSRWVLEEGWADEAEEGTQTLQRRAPPAAAPAPATATLPQPVTKQTTRNAKGPPSNWENWFNTIPDSDTDSEDEFHVMI